MTHIRNDTPFAVMPVPNYDPDGREAVTCVIKATLRLEDRCDAEPLPSAEQCPIATADEFWGEPGTSPVKLESDLAPFKPGTDVVLLGFAYDARGRPTNEQRVTLRVGPVGKSSTVKADQKSDRLPLHLLEPDAEPKSWWRARGRRPKAGFGFFPKAHEPRLAYAGTYDERWKEERSPFLPADFDYRFFQCAYPDLIAPGYLRGGEEIAIEGVTPSGRLRTRLPRIALRVDAYLEDGVRTQPAALDTVILEPESRRLIAVWRTLFHCRGPFHDLQGMWVQSAEPAGAPA